MIFSVDLPVTGLAVGMLVHRALNLDRRSVPEPRVVPAGPLEIEATLFGHPFLDGGPEVVRPFRAVHADHARRAPIYILLRWPRAARPSVASLPSGSERGGLWATLKGG